MLAITATDDWRTTHPGATIGRIELSGRERPVRSGAGDVLERRLTDARGLITLHSALWTQMNADLADSKEGSLRFQRGLASRFLKCEGTGPEVMFVLLIINGVGSLPDFIEQFTPG